MTQTPTEADEVRAIIAVADDDADGGSAPPESTPAPRPKPALLSPVRAVKGESRAVLLAHVERDIAARLVRVGSGGVDRETGDPAHTYFEITVKVPRTPENTKTFSSERNARIAYLVAQHGVVDFATPLMDLGPRLWQEPKNMTLLAGGSTGRCGRPKGLSRTRINSGDFDARSPKAGGGAISILSGPERRSIAHDDV